jgi:transcriptional regulator with XRE-family HTH domain
MDIKSVLKKYNENTYTIAEKLNIKQPSVMQYINGNPTVKKLEDLARAIGCSPAEFFSDWPSTEPAVMQQPAAETSPADELPFDHQPEPEKQAVQTGATMQEPLICPHCGQAFIVEVKKIANPD